MCAFITRSHEPNTSCATQSEAVTLTNEFGQQELVHRGNGFDARSGQLFVEEIYDLRTNRAPSVWLAQCLCSYKEQLCSRDTRGQKRETYGS